MDDCRPLSSPRSEIAISVPASGSPLRREHQAFDAPGCAAACLTPGGTAIGCAARAAGRPCRSRSARSGGRARCRHRACRRPRRATSVSYQPRAASGRPSGPSIGAISASAIAIGRVPSIDDAAAQPVALVGQRDEMRAVRRDAQIAERPPKSLCGELQHQAAAEFQRAEARARGIARIERLRSACGWISIATGGARPRGVCAAAGTARAAAAQPRAARSAAPQPVSTHRGTEAPAVVASRVEPARGRRVRGSTCGVLLEQFGELLGHGAAKLLGIDDGDGAAVVARHVVADADGDQLDRRARLDLLDDLAQMPLEIVAGIDRQRGIVDRRAVGDHHQDLALLGARRAGACAPSRAPRRRCSP